ncbi:DUF6702 family protein [Spirosoma fluviale]|uniref:Orphan protein n=1 Tax=Spirosoma fluviale TaxID=1597977 RepID=A0A286FY35_9BACT|nr:DUF6702 family protein [Spirosoma fluviale]SOD88201.1 hypothetical protein SAMN06269250_2549 [Spirosoma fluviale]
MINFLIRSGFLVLLVGLLSGSTFVHEFHASVTQMQYDPKEHVFEISVRLFTDDFEKALAEATRAKVNLSGKTKHDLIIEKYIESHFVYTSPQKQVKPIKYVGYEVEADAHWIYLEMPYSEPFRGGLLKQNALMEVFDDQVNMVNVQYQSQKKTFVFRKNQATQDISFDR